jgi:hypothetical protein
VVGNDVNNDIKDYNNNNDDDNNNNNRNNNRNDNNDNDNDNNNDKDIDHGKSQVIITPNNEINVEKNSEPSNESEIIENYQNNALISEKIEQVMIDEREKHLTDVQVTPFLSDELTRVLWTRLCVVRAQIAKAENGSNC